MSRRQTAFLLLTLMGCGFYLTGLAMGPEIEPHGSNVTMGPAIEPHGVRLAIGPAIEPNGGLLV